MKKKKNAEWLDKEKKDLKRRKKELKKVGDSTIFKKVNSELKREYRSKKRAEKQNNKKVIDEELNKWRDKGKI